MLAYWTRSFLSVAFLAFLTDGFGQNHCWTKYNYDAAGNRIKRYWWCGDPNTTDGEENGETKSAMSPDFGLRLIPNPAGEQVQLTSTTELSNAELNVLDLQGRMVLTQRFSGSWVELDVSRWSAGRYTLRLRTEQEEYTTSFSVIH
jgi:hypothetical protein